MDQSMDLDVENLFSEENLHQATLDHDILPPDHSVLPSATAVLPPGLAERIASLSYHGSIPRIAWSRQGHIARIVNDGTGVELSCQRYNCRSNKWELSKPKLLDVNFDSAAALAWSSSGVDLAVADSQGRFQIFSMTPTCLNRLNEGRSYLLDAPSEAARPVGLYWLNHDRSDKPKQVLQKMVKADTKWTNVMVRAKTLPPVHPRALIAVNQTAMMTFLYQRSDGHYQTTTARLPLPAASLLTHAAFSPTSEGKLLVVVHSADGTLDTFLVDIVGRGDSVTNAPGDVKPSLKISIIESNLPTLPSFTQSQDVLVAGNTGVDSWMLTHLDVVQASETIVEGSVDDNDPTTRHYPTILAVYTSYNRTINAAEPGFLQNSVIRRWAMKNMQLKLHPRFNDMQGANKGAAGTAHHVLMEKLPDTIFTNIISSVQIIENGSLIATTTQDGKSEIWYSVSMSQVKAESQMTKISSIFETGFVFPVSALPILHCLSPNAFAVITSNMDDTLQCTNVQLHELGQQPQNKDLVLNVQDPSEEAAITSYVLSLSRGCLNSSNSDDVISSIHANVSPKSFPIIVEYLYKTLFGPTEFISERAPGSELDMIFQKALAGKVLALHYILHKAHPYKGAAPREAPMTRLWAWLSLNLRYSTAVLSIFHQLVRSPRPQPNAPQQPPPPPPSLPPAYVQMICNDIRWIFSIFAFIFQTILEVGDRKTNPEMFDPPDFDTLLGDEKGDGSQGLVALLLNCNWSRNFLVTLGRIMRSFVSKVSSISTPMTAATPLGRIVRTIQQCVETIGISVNAIEILVDARWHPDTPGSNKQQSQDSPEVVTQRQIKMMSTGIVSEVYQGTIRRILTNCINGENGLRKRKEINRLKLIQETPDRSWFLLNMDDITFQRHTPITTASDGTGSDNSNMNGSAKLTKKPGRKLWDVHKKVAITFPLPGTTLAPSQPANKLDLSKQLIRRCVRCGSLSEDVKGIDRSWPRNMTQFLARCVCDGYWIIEEFGEF